MNASPIEQCDPSPIGPFAWKDCKCPWQPPREQRNRDCQPFTALLKTMMERKFFCVVLEWPVCIFNWCGARHILLRLSWSELLWLIVYYGLTCSVASWQLIHVWILMSIFLQIMNVMGQQKHSCITTSVPPTTTTINYSLTHSTKVSSKQEPHIRQLLRPSFLFIRSQSLHQWFITTHCTRYYC